MNKIVFTVAIVVMAFARVNAQAIPKWKLEDLKAAINETDKPTIYNFWATFCKPCVEEIPYFQQLVKKYDSAGVELVLVSLDLPDAYPGQIASFASKHKFTSPIKFLNETNADVFCPAVDSSWSGAIPASLFVNNKTGYRKFFEEQLSREKLEREIQNMLRKS